MDHFVVGEGKNEVLVERIQHSEREVVLVMRPVHRIAREVLQGVVHPAHVPLEPEAEAAEVGGARDPGPGGGLLGNRERSRVAPVGRPVEVAQELDGLEMFVPAVVVGEPLTVLARVVEIQHRSDCIDANPVEVVLVEPEHGARDQEAADLGPAVVEDGAVPVGVPSLPPVRVLVQRVPIEPAEPMAVGREMRRHPVEDDADACLVQLVDEVHQILGRAVAGARSEVRRALISPRRVIGMLGDGEQLDVGEPHVGHVSDEGFGELPVRERVAGGVLPPRAEMDLVDGHRGIPSMPVDPARHPFMVTPLVVEVPHDGRGLGRHLGRDCERVRLLDETLLLGPDPVLVGLAGRDVVDLGRPDEPFTRLHRVRFGVPVIEVAHHGNPGGVGSPHRKAGRRAVEMRTEVLVGADVRALAVQVDGVIRNDVAHATSQPGPESNGRRRDRLAQPPARSDA